MLRYSIIFWMTGLCVCAQHIVPYEAKFHKTSTKGYRLILEQPLPKGYQVSIEFIQSTGKLERIRNYYSLSVDSVRFYVSFTRKRDTLQAVYIAPKGTSSIEKTRAYDLLGVLAQVLFYKKWEYVLSTYDELSIEKGRVLRVLIDEQVSRAVVGMLLSQRQEEEMKILKQELLEIQKKRQEIFLRLSQLPSTQSIRASTESKHVP